MKLLFIIPLLIVLIIPTCMFFSIPERYIMFEDDISIMRHDNTYVVDHSFTVLVGDDGVIVPKDYETALDNIPFTIKAPYTATIAVLVMHSYLYDCPEFYTRYEADVALYNGLIAANDTKWDAFKKFMMVRMFSKSKFSEGVQCSEQFD